MIITKSMSIASPVDNKDLWATPQRLFDKINSKFKFTLDPCCTIETAKCAKFYTPKENGLFQYWNDETVFVNPPYSRGNIDTWVKKCYDEANPKHCTVVALLPVSTSADWFQKYCIGNTLYFINKRVRFEGAPFTAPFSSVFVHFNGINQSLTFQQ